MISINCAVSKGRETPKGIKNEVDLPHHKLINNKQQIQKIADNYNKGF